MRANMDALVDLGLSDLGYTRAGIDEGWEGCGDGVNGTQHFVNGTPATNPKLFPVIYPSIYHFLPPVIFSL